MFLQFSPKIGPKSLQMGLLGAFLGHLGAFLAVFFAFLAVFFASFGQFLGLPALSEPYLGASWGQVGLQDRFQDDFWSKNAQISLENPQILKVLKALFSRFLM